MPYSGDLLDDVARSYFNAISEQVNLILDVGVGAGKYGQMWRALKPPVVIEGVEIDERYHDEFADIYSTIYDEVALNSIMNFLDTPRVAYDLVIFGDVLEHMKKSDGVDILNFFMYRSKFIYVQYPHHYLQNDEEGKWESHISIWSDKDFQMLDTSFSTVNRAPLTAVAISGFLPHTPINAGGIWNANSDSERY